MKLLAGVLALGVLVAITVALANTGDDPTTERPSRDSTTAPPPEEPDFPLPLHSEPPDQDGDVSGAFVNPDGERVLLNSVNLFPLHGDPPSRHWDLEDYQSIRAQGFTAVRFLLTWANFEPESGRFQGLEELDRAVRSARAAGLYVVLLTMQIDDWNSPPAWTAGADKIQQISLNAKAWVQELARRYRDEDAVAAYDLAAQLPSADQNRLLRLYSKMIKWVREVAPEKVLITTAGWGDSDVSPGRVDPTRLAGHENIVHSFHDYFAGDGNPATTSLGYNSLGMLDDNQTWDGVSGYPNPDDRGDLEAHLQHHIDYARRAGVPIWIGEYGVNPDAQNADELIAQKTELYDRYGIGRSWWLYACGENFGLKDENCDWRPIADALT